MSLDSNTTGLNEILDMAKNLPTPEDLIKVKSVNGKTGNVVLNASDVHALPDTVSIPTIPENVSDFNNDAGYLTEHQSLAEYPKRAETEKHTADVVSAHNTNTETHKDIRLLIKELTDRINAIADSDDTTLDQLSEIVAYIKSNKSLIDAITTEKISYSDIINNLETNVSNKPLSASMGVVLKAAIDAIVIPTKVSAFENDKGYLTEHQSLDGYAKTSDVEALKQPFVVTCVADMQNMVYTNVSHTFEEIKKAYLRGDHIFVIADIGQMHAGRYTVAPLTSYGDNHMLFEYVSISGSKSYLVTGFLHSDNANSFSMTELVSQTQLNGLTFKTSSSVPTVDDRSVIAFVIEE